MGNRLRIRFVGLFVLVCAILSLFALTGCQKEKTFSAAGMTITLTTKFKEVENINFTACYERNDVLVVMRKEEFSLLGTSKYTVQEYAWEVIDLNGRDSYTKNEEDYVSFTYEATAGGKDFYYYNTCFKTHDAYWLIQFACETKSVDKLQDDFEKWANSIVFE